MPFQKKKMIWHSDFESCRASCQAVRCFSLYTESKQSTTHVKWLLNIRVWADRKLKSWTMERMDTLYPQFIIEHNRAITLLSCLGKIYVRMIDHHRLVTFVGSNHIIHPSQQAFRYGRDIPIDVVRWIIQ